MAGYSLGGRLALGLISAAPSRFRRALILSAHPGLQTLREREERIARDAQWIRLLRAEGIESFVSAWESQPLFANQSQLDPERLWRQRRQRLAHNPERLALCLEQLGLGWMPNLRDAVAHFPGHLSWVAGASDPKFLSIAQDMKTIRPSTHLHVLPEIGHNPLLECPRWLEPLIHETAGRGSWRASISDQSREDQP